MTSSASSPSFTQLTGRRPLIVMVVIVSAFLLSRLTHQEQTALRSSSHDAQIMRDSTTKSNIDTERTQKYAFLHRGKYRLRAKIQATERLFGFMKNLGLDNKDSVVLVGGTHDGMYPVNILKQCPSMTLYGFEIVKEYYDLASEALKPYSHASVLNLGWDEQANKNVPIGGVGKQSGLYDPKGQHGWSLREGETTDTVALASWASKKGIAQALFVLIETEGREPKVIRGMKLNDRANRERFPLFQYELGATWAESDNRHGHDEWDQRAAAQHLIGSGYRLFLIGQEDWLEVNADFFQKDGSNPALARSTNWGRYVQGNVLAMHPELTPNALAQLIVQHSHVETL